MRGSKSAETTFSGLPSDPNTDVCPLPRHIQPAHTVRIGQIKRFAVFAAIDFGVSSPGFFCVAASLFDHVGGVEPALQVSTAEFAFGVFLVAGALSRLLEFDFVMREAVAE